MTFIFMNRDTKIGIISSNYINEKTIGGNSKIISLLFHPFSGEFKINNTLRKQIGEQKVDKNSVFTMKVDRKNDIVVFSLKNKADER